MLPRSPRGSFTTEICCLVSFEILSNDTGAAELWYRWCRWQCFCFAFVIMDLIWGLQYGVYMLVTYNLGIRAGVPVQRSVYLGYYAQYIFSYSRQRTQSPALLYYNKFIHPLPRYPPQRIVLASAFYLTSHLPQLSRYQYASQRRAFSVQVNQRN